MSNDFSQSEATLSPASSSVEEEKSGVEQTATPRVGNLLRAEWRQKCRVALSNHLKGKGIPVEPCQVRLIPTEEDEYKWELQPEVEYLFKKQMSKCSVGVYEKLYNNVGKLFEAIKVSQNYQACSSGVSFTSKIRQLQEDKAQLKAELERWKSQAQEFHSAHENAEKQLQQSDSHLQAAQAEVDQLLRQKSDMSVSIKQLRRKVARSDRIIKRVTTALQKSES